MPGSVETQQEDAITGVGRPQASTNRAAHERPIYGPQTQSRGRDKSGVTTSAKIAEFPQGAGITSISVACYFTTAPVTADLMAAAGDVRGRICIDPASDAIAAALLASLNSVVDDNGYYTIPISLPGSYQPITIDLIGTPDSNGDIITHGSLSGGVIYGAANDGATDLTFEVWGQ